MRETELFRKQKLKYPDLSLLESAVRKPLFGSDGGNPYSPVWFCALEWGQGFKNNECTPKNYFSVDQYEQLTQKDLEELLNGRNPFNKDENGESRSTRSKIYHAYVLLLTAIIGGDFSKSSDSKLINLVKAYDFFSRDETKKSFLSNRYGFLLNAYPIPVKTHTDKDWDKIKVLREESTISFNVWTGLKGFKEYRDWCIQERRKGFCGYRKQYHPKIIYCGGITDANNFFRMWTDDSDVPAVPTTEYLPRGDGKRMRLIYKWVKNEPFNDTLLVVGYSFSSSRASSCLGANLERCKTVGNFLRELCERHFGNNFAWLDRKTFDPTYIKE